MQNTMRAHSAGQISMEGGVDVNKGHMVYTQPYAKPQKFYLNFVNRESLKVQYSSNSQDRFKRDYQRTQQDWTRMELDKLRDIHEVNRSHMRITCGTYLGTSTGSRKAIKSLTKVLE